MHRSLVRRLMTAAALIMLVVAIGCHAYSRGGTADAAAAPHHRTSAHARPPAQVPAHVQTAEYLWTAQEKATDKRTYAPYLTWAYADYKQYADVKHAGIKTVLYTNVLMPYHTETFDYGELMRNPDLLAKDCSGNVIQAYNGASRMLDVRNPRAVSAVREVADNYIDMLRRANGTSERLVDVLFVDNANEFYHLSAPPCGVDQQQWTQDVETAVSQMGLPVVLNTLTVRPEVVPKRLAALHGRNIVGVMYEACFADTQWTAEEIAQISAVQMLRALHKPAGPGFWCYVNGERGVGLASSVIPRRLFDYASFLLTYDPQYSVYQTAYDSPPSTFKVLPETQFVPLDPVTAVSDVSQLRTSGGAYVREYQYCYYRRKLLGSCEIAVNPGDSNTDIPNDEQYRHSAVLQGNGVLDGGTMSFKGPAVDDLAPGTAAILVP